MDSASFQFLGFGLAVVLISNFSRSHVWRSSILMLASVIFLGLLAGTTIALIPLIGFLLLGYVGIFLIEHGWSKFAAWGVPAVILVYVWLKKYTFLPDGVFLHSLYFTLGLSYIFFRVLHLMIEMRDSREKQQIGLGAYLLYTLNFTSLVSGPIQRYDEFARDQFTDPPIALGAGVIGRQLERIVRGFFKVNVLAMLLDLVRDDALSQMNQPLPPGLKLFAAFKIAIAYPLFLYANFSGYIDIVIALARLMRVRLPENFDRPFEASSVLDFWNRWHMTLSSWFKTYVYNPLLVTLMRSISSPALQPFLGVFCFFVTFFLVGIWHGRTSEFIFFGLLTGGGISINKLWQLGWARVLGRKGYRELANNFIYVAFGRGLNFSWFSFTLFWFWADWKQIDELFNAIGIAHWLAVWSAIWLCASIALTFWELLRTLLLGIKTAEGPVLTSRYARVAYASALGLIAFIMTVLLNQPAPAIVYKVF
jgi:D-alanyl-lipoteichoic acid acyltransferase DltB (MBOAT superfamily)